MNPGPVVVLREKSHAVPVGNSINSCIASLLPAWLPPLMTLNAGTGRITSAFPARSAMCLYNGTPLSGKQDAMYSIIYISIIIL